MNSIDALVLTGYGADTLAVAPVAPPVAGHGQVVVRVHAAGVNAIDWKLRAGHVRDAFPLQLPAVLGIELAGEVAAVGPGVTALRLGDRVLGPKGGLGAYAELVAVDAAKLALVPASMSMTQAAALPMAAGGGWNSLHFAGPVRAGQRILIHGAAGGLGGFAVQFAHQAGAVVYATARSTQADYVRSLGADHVIAYDQQRFEDVVGDIDLVLDYAGGDVAARSWAVLAADGAIVSTAAPDIVANTPAGRRGLWFQNTPDTARLQAIVDAVAQGRLQSRVASVVRLADLPAAIERLRTGANAGKTVVTLID